MRSTLLLAAVAALAAPTAVCAADPPITFQTQPIGRALVDARATVKLVAGDDAVKEFNKSLERTFGAKGFEGLDLTRPIVGYVIVPENLLDSVVVVALPVTGEKDFLDLCERTNGSKPAALPGGLYELPALHPAVKAVCRVTNQYAYIATGRDPNGALAQANIVPTNKLFDPAEQGLATAKIHFDRFAPGTQDKALAMIDEYRKNKLGAGGGFGAQEMVILNPLLNLVTQSLTQSKDAHLAVVRLALDPRTGDFSAEATLTAKPGTALEKTIAARKPNTNKFASLVTPDMAIGFRASLPLFNDELKTSAVKALEELAKQIPPGGGPAGAAALDELIKGAIRTVKAGDVDFAGALRGPDKKGLFTAIGAIAFEDAIPLEKAFRKFVDAEGPADLKKTLKWDVAKAGKVNINTITFPDDGGFIFRDLIKPFGNTPTLAFAFAPNGIFIALGPDAIDAIKDAVVMKPTPSPIVDVVVNPARLGKFAGVIDPTGPANVERVLGKDDKAITMMSLTVEGGKELKVRYTISMKTLGSLGARAASTAPGDPNDK